MSTVKQGTVKFFNDDKRYGFITPDDSSKDIFVHASGVIGRIHENDIVEYEEEQGERGLSAVNVQVVS